MSVCLNCGHLAVGTDTEKGHWVPDSGVGELRLCAVLVTHQRGPGVSDNVEEPCGCPGLRTAPVEVTSSQFDDEQVESLRALFKRAEAAPDKDMKIEAALPVSSFLHNSYAGVRVCLKVIDRLRAERVSVGVDYCTVHDGLRNEDGHGCDWAVHDLTDKTLDLSATDGEPRECVLVPLTYDRADVPLPVETVAVGDSL